MDHNLDIQIARKSEEIADAAVAIEASAFQPRVDGSIVGYSSENSDRDWNLVGRETLPTGTELRVESGSVFFDASERANSTSRGERMEWELRLRQPLLSGNSIKANTAALRQARIAAETADATTLAEIFGVLRTTESAYWTAAYAAAVWKTEKERSRRAAQLHSISKTRFEEGAAAKIDLLETDAAVALARDGEARALQRFQDALTNLSFVLGEPIAKTETSAEFANLKTAQIIKTVDPELSFKSAFEHSPGAVLLENQVRTSEARLAAASNNVLPDVDAEVNYGNAGFFDSSSSDDPSATNWNALLRVSIPWNFQAKRAELKASKARLEASKHSLQQGLRALKRDIFQTCRSIDSGHVQLEAATAAASLQSAKWDEQLVRFKEGIASTRDVIETEQEYREAAIREMEARLRLVLASVLLSTQQGTIPTRNNLSI